MLDTMTFTKTLGALCGALLVFLLGRWAAETLYDVSHGGEEVAAYSVEVEEAPSEPEPEVSFEEAYAMADASAGERVWGQCRACHQLEVGANAVGPYLHGVVGREIGAVDDFRYSGALSENVDGAEAWTPEALNAFLIAPAQWAPGTSMSYRGLDDLEDRVNLIAYLDASDE